MFVYRRFVLLATAFAVIVLVLLAFRSRENIRSSRIWREMPQRVGLGEWIADNDDEYRPEREALLQSSLNITEGQTEIIKGQASDLTYGPSKFHPGTPKAAGSTYTKAVVMGRILSENITWLDEATLPAGIQTYIYGIDDPDALLKTPRNKGREAMVYLSYIIDHYDSLPDVSIFLHAHQMAWHNNELLTHDAAEMIKRLSSERVTREGYMNLRCHWKPGCPDWLNLAAVYAATNRPEEASMAEAWAMLFPDDPIPAYIGSACCAQFAVSRERIRAVPLHHFKHYRNWLLRTSLSDGISGRIFEYLWAKIFTDQSTFCPDQRICYCDGYGVCFEDDKEFDYWFELRFKRTELAKRLDLWYYNAEELEHARNAGASLEGQELIIPAVDEDVWLLHQMDQLSDELERRRHDALQAGNDPAVRARIAHRPWKEGDGY